MRVNPYLNFNGTCKDAFAFYERLFGGESLAMMTYKGTPAEEYCPAGHPDAIMHACLKVGNEFLMGSDAFGEMYQPMQGMSVTLNIDEPAEAERVFKALAEGGTVRMPIQETFWALRFGDVIDRYGTPWLINCTRPDYMPGAKPADAKRVA